ncbi:MAG: hypothetical protein U1F70_00715 [Candidatus Competibacteraceae bacterium]
MSATLDLDLLKTFGQIAAPAGLAIGVFLYLCRDIVAKSIFPTLTRQHGYHVVIALAFMAWTVALAGIASWTYVSTHAQADSSRKKISMVGSWSGSPDCTVIFNKDDGEEVEGDCDNIGYKHHFKGIYDAPDSIRVTITRTDPEKCITNTQGHIKINNPYSATFGQSGWNGCGVTTSSGTQSWSRM